MLRVALLVLFTCSLCPAQLTPQQKIDDLRQLAALYNKNYGPYEWKKLAFGYDALDLRPWIESALATKDDIEYWDLIVRYVYSLNDAHDVVTVNSNFSASLGFTVDLYDWRPLIDSITRSRLPASRYPFEIGDELVSIDGVSVNDWIQRLMPYSGCANLRSTMRQALSRLTTRSQSRIPWAHLTADSSEVVVKRASGEQETYTIPWLKTGIAMTFNGPVPDPAGRSARDASRQAELDRNDALEPWQMPLRELLVARVVDDGSAVLNSGGRSPIFSLPANFQQRLGRTSSDVFYSGWYEADGLRIGFIRVPSFSPGPGVTEALRQFDIEIAWMRDNTDGLVIDDMRNPGGYVNYVEEMCRRLIQTNFRNLGFEVRASQNYLYSFASAWYSAANGGASADVVQGYLDRYIAIQEAYKENRGRTRPVSLTNPTLFSDPVKDRNGSVISYNKPIVILVDEFSASGGDAFPATMQDNKAAVIFGYRTMGAGGSVVDYPDAASYTELNTRVTVSLMNRKNPVKTDGYPEAPYVENIGVRPDIEWDYMTRDNLMNAGKPFVDGFTWAITNQIRKTAGN
jgi:hypothetical protein